MANETFSLAAAPSSTSRLDSVAEGAFVALLLLVFVTLTPFQPPADGTIFGGDMMTGRGGGDAWRQIAFLSVFSTTVFCAALKRGTDMIRSMPLLLAMLLLWCMASALWAAAAGITMRRAGLAIVIVTSVMISIDTIGARRALTLWRYVLAGVLAINWISIPLIAEARHMAGEIDPALVGNWRGLYGHKNTAGAVSAITAIVFFFSAIDRRRWLDFGIFILAAAFLVMTRSKTSIGILPVAILAGCVYRYAWRQKMDRVIVSVAAGLVAVVSVLALYLSFGAIMSFLNDPSELTGRTAIWQAEFAYIRDHFLLGAGFGSFANTGGLSPLHDYMSLSWVGIVSHGHSGYLQILVTVGAMGFALAVLGLLLQPAIVFLRQPGSRVVGLSVLFALFVFGILHNVMETVFLEGDSPAWISFLIMLAALGASERQESTSKLLTPRA